MFPINDLHVLAAIGLGTAGSAVLLWRRGVRGGRLAGALWIAFYSFALILMMAAHTADITYHLVQRHDAFDGTPWAYDFRFYALQLLSAVLLWQGAASLRRLAGVGRREAGAERAVLRSALVVLAVVAPLIPVHAFFGVILTVLSTATLLVTALLQRRAAAVAAAA